MLMLASVGSPSSYRLPGVPLSVADELELSAKSEDDLLLIQRYTSEFTDQEQEIMELEDQVDAARSKLRASERQADLLREQKRVLEQQLEKLSTQLQEFEYNAAQQAREEGLR